MHKCPECGIETDVAINVRWGKNRGEEYWCFACAYEYGKNRSDIRGGDARSRRTP